MYDYTIVPSEKIKKRMDFFYTPINQKFLLRKHMTFEDEEPEEESVDPKEKRRPISKSGLSDINVRLAA